MSVAIYYYNIIHITSCRPMYLCCSMGGHGVLPCALKNPGIFVLSVAIYYYNIILITSFMPMYLCCSMGGHGALLCALKNPGMFRSVSAFAPICNPTECPWGQKAFGGYLGENKDPWLTYDATCLVPYYQGPPLHLLVDQVLIYLCIVES